MQGLVACCEIAYFIKLINPLTFSVGTFMLFKHKIDRFLSWLKKVEMTGILSNFNKKCTAWGMSRVSYEGTPFNYQILLLSFCQQKTLTLSWWKTSFCLLSNDRIDQTMRNWIDIRASCFWMSGPTWSISSHVYCPSRFMGGPEHSNTNKMDTKLYHSNLRIKKICNPVTVFKQAVFSCWLYIKSIILFWDFMQITRP